MSLSRDEIGSNVDIYEKVFIAWGGNQPLAKSVGHELSKDSGFAPVVGGGKQVDLYVGTQIFSQINTCTRAIILIQDTTNTKEASSGLNLNDNLMFEWGYLMGRLPPNKIHVFLIDLSAKDLPSDLAGSWASEVSSAGKSDEVLSKEIADSFINDALRVVETDGMAIMHKWETVKSYLETYDVSPKCSDIELTQYLLHNVETCYYYMEEEQLEKLIGNIHPISSILEFAIHFVEGNIRLFKETDDLMKPIAFDSFVELKALFERKLDISFQDEELNLWFEYFLVRRQALLHRMVAFSEDFEEEESAAFLHRSFDLLDRADASLSTIVAKFPERAAYACMYFGYINRDRSYISAYFGDKEKAAEFNRQAVKAMETFYLDYKRVYPYDTYLIRQFAQEYYLSLAEQLEYCEDAAEQMMIKRSIKAFLQKADQETSRQHVVLRELHDKFNNVGK